MSLWAFMFLLFSHLPDAPKRICLPIQIPQNSPVEFALNAMREEAVDHGNKVEISCSQPDFQLFYAIDKSLKSEDDFILIISDVNIEISGGSDRGVMYGILEFLQQLRAKDYEVSEVRSVVSHPDVDIRGLQINYQYLLAGGPILGWPSFFNEMVALRFNYLIISNMPTDKIATKPLDDEAISELKDLARTRNIGLEFQNFSPDTFGKKGLEVNSGVVVRKDLQRTDFRLKNQMPDFERLSKIKEYPTVVVDVDGRRIHNFSNWHQLQWYRIFADRNRVPPKVILDCTDQELWRADSPDFLVHYRRYFSNWSQQLEHPQVFTPMPAYACLSESLSERVQAAESASVLLGDCFVNDEYGFDWRTFQRIDKLNQGHFYMLERMLDDLHERNIFSSKSKTPNKLALTTVIDSLKTLQLVLENHGHQDCTDLALDHILLDLADFSTCLSYTLHKLESLLQLSKYVDLGKRQDKLQAINHINSANEVWDNRWRGLDVNGKERSEFKPRWNKERKRELEVIKKLRN